MSDDVFMDDDSSTSQSVDSSLSRWVEPGSARALTWILLDTLQSTSGEVVLPADVLAHTIPKY